MQVVGIDFGTSNVRIATWDSEGDLPPQPKLIGAQDTPAMPAVVALERRDNGEVATLVGEEADGLEDEDNRRIVIRNIKRIALSSDDYVQWHLDARNTHEAAAKWPPAWWNAERRCVQAWGQEYPVWNLISSILEEAFWRADIQGEYEWRAGCPVHSDYDYRRSLAETLSRVTDNDGSPFHVIEEPLLFLTAARRLGDLREGTFLIYDFGGGSFDCALVELKESDELLIYGADGHPLLGGSDIDERLARKLNYTGQTNLLRQAKESLTADIPAASLQAGIVLTLETLGSVLKEGKFVEKSESVSRDAYIVAKTLWNRGEGPDDPPAGEILYRDRSPGTVRFVWQMNWGDLANDVDGFILFGGPTKSPHFRECLEKLFGADKILAAEDLLAGLQDAAITGAGIGACYSWDSSPSHSSLMPSYLNRLPVGVVLEDKHTGDKVEYAPFDHFTKSARRAFSAFLSERSLPVIQGDLLQGKRYELTVAYPNSEGTEVLIPTTSVDGSTQERQFVDRFINTNLIDSSVKLVIDRFGQVAVQQQSQTSSAKIEVIIEDSPWQTEQQRQYLAAKLEQDKRYRNEVTAKIHSNTQRRVHPDHN